MDILLLTKLVLAHLITDFLLQPRQWIEDRRRYHFRSAKLYLHTALTAVVALLLTGFRYWLIALIIFITHTLIDGWKSRKPDNARYFLADQVLHLAVLFACWWFTYYDFQQLYTLSTSLIDNTHLLVRFTAFTFLTLPAGYMVGHLTRKWSSQLPGNKGLQNAGKWIGVIERVIILALVLHQQYSAIGLLIAAKGIIRFGESNRTEQKTEYLLIGTLISFSIALLTGLLVLEITG